MIDCREKTCTGCGACTIVCPKGESCLSMCLNEIGEYEPSYGEGCIKCEACVRVCNAVQTPFFPKNIQASYYGWAEKDKVRISSTSGGIFQQIAIKFIEDGGCVVGAAYSPDYKEVEHIIVDGADSLSKICRSKYTESIVWKVFPEIKKLLNKGQKVLFSGVPCQVSQLNLFLNREYENLYTIEIFCHGEPRIGVWKRYINWLNHRVGQLEDIQFRDKSQGGWEKPVYNIQGSNKTLKEHHNKNIYHLMFGYHESLRRSCYQCKYRTETRYADLSLGDFWGIRKYYPNVEPYKGVSAILMNSEKGRALLDNNSLALFECNKEEIFDLNKWMIMNFETPNTLDSYNKRYINIPNDRIFFYISYLMYKTMYRFRNIITRIVGK